MLIFHEIRIPEFLSKTVKVLSVTARERKNALEKKKKMSIEKERKGDFSFLNRIILYFP